MPRRYAEATDVSSEKSRAAIEKILHEHGAQAFGYATQGQRARVMFELAGRRIVFEIGLPDRSAREFTHTRHQSQYQQKRLSAESAADRYEQAVRQRWRALYLVIRAKLEAVEAGIATLEDEFLAYVQLPSGETVGELARPAIAEAYAGRPMPALLPGRKD